MDRQFGNILVYVKGSPATDSGLERAVALARASDARLKLFGVVGSESPRETRDMKDSAFEMMRAREEELKARAKSLRQLGLAASVAVRYGQPSAEIAREVRSAKHDLVFKTAAPGDCASRWRFYGDTATALMRVCPCPVWLTRKKETPYRRVLAAIDPIDIPQRREINRAVMDFAVGLAAAEGGQVHVVHAWNTISMGMLSGRLPWSEMQSYITSTQRAVSDAVREYLTPYSEHISYTDGVHIPRGVPEQCIPEVSAEISADVVVMGTFARSGLRGYLIGNTAEKLIPRIGASVVTVKPPSLVASSRAVAESAA